MIHGVAILIGLMIIAGIVGFFYVIHSVLTHFGFDTEEIIVTGISVALGSAIAWIIGTIALEMLGII